MSQSLRNQVKLSEGTLFFISNHGHFLARFL